MVILHTGKLSDKLVFQLGEKCSLSEDGTSPMLLFTRDEETETQSCTGGTLDFWPSWVLPLVILINSILFAAVGRPGAVRSVGSAVPRQVCSHDSSGQHKSGSAGQKKKLEEEEAC